MSGNKLWLAECIVPCKDYSDEFNIRHCSIKGQSEIFSIFVDCRGAVAGIRDSYTDDPSSIPVRFVVASWLVIFAHVQTDPPTHTHVHDYSIGYTLATKIRTQF